MGILRGSTIKLPKVRFLIFVSIIALPISVNIERIGVGSGKTNLFIRPGHDFKIVDVMITNFHLPKSSLLMLVSAFIGIEKMFQIYQYAIEEKYRFFSYGDAMLLEKKL